MKFKSKTVLLFLLVAVMATWVISSCTKDTPLSLAAVTATTSSTSIKHYKDSVHIHDSLALIYAKNKFMSALTYKAAFDSLNKINAAGLINYSVQVVSGSTSTLFAGTPNISDRSSAGGGAPSVKAQDVVAGATVTVNQYGVIAKATTDATGTAVFANLLRGGLSVSITQTGFTSLSYITALKNSNWTTNNGTQHSMGNIIPLFETTGANMATITGQATVETDLTNNTPETIPDASKTNITATIDATNSSFLAQYLNTGYSVSTHGGTTDYVGTILTAAYGTGGFSGVVTGGIYTIGVPASVDGLPLIVSYSDFVGTQTLFIQTLNTNAQPNVAFNQVVTNRQLFGPELTPTYVPVACGVTVNFSAGGGGAATAVMNYTGLLSQINLNAGGSGYNGTPLVTITGGGGAGATATATVTGGVVTAFTLTSPGSGYTSAPSVNVLSGTGATATSTLNNINQSVFSVDVTNNGSANYATAPTVTFSAPTGITTGTTATGTAVISNGVVVSITINNQGSGYSSAPTVTYSGGTAVAGAVIVAPNPPNSVTMGAPILSLNLYGSPLGGSAYNYAPVVTLTAPDLAAGTQATATAIVNPLTQTVTGFTITNAGSGYQNPPAVTIQTYTSAATGSASLQGGSVLSAVITNTGSQYVGAPTITFVATSAGGQGATGTVTIANGIVTGITITNGGTGYNTAPTIHFNDPTGATAFANVSATGTITSVTIGNGGKYYTAPPVVTITPTGAAAGSGAAGTATVNAAGQVTGVTLSSGGTGYQIGNIPSAKQYFAATNGLYDCNTNGLNTKVTSIITVVGKTFANDVYYGTGQNPTLELSTSEGVVKPSVGSKPR
jgi:hypothetical protein